MTKLLWSRIWASLFFRSRFMIARSSKIRVIWLILAAFTTVQNLNWSLYSSPHPCFWCFSGNLKSHFKYGNVHESEKYAQNNTVFRTSGMSKTRLRNKNYIFLITQWFCKQFSKKIQKFLQTTIITKKLLFLKRAESIIVKSDLRNSFF